MMKCISLAHLRILLSRKEWAISWPMTENTLPCWGLWSTLICPCQCPRQDAQAKANTHPLSLMFFLLHPLLSHHYIPGFGGLRWGGGRYGLESIGPYEGWTQSIEVLSFFSIKASTVCCQAEHCVHLTQEVHLALNWNATIPKSARSDFLREAYFHSIVTSSHFTYLYYIYLV